MRNTALVRIRSVSIQQKQHNTKSQQSTKMLREASILGNTFCSLFFGYIEQTNYRVEIAVLLRSSASCILR